MVLLGVVKWQVVFVWNFSMRKSTVITETD